MSSTTTPLGEAERLIWVREVAGQTRVRWIRIAAFLAAIIAGGLGSSAIVGWFSGTSTNPLALLAMLCLPAAYLVIVVELQLTRLRSGDCRVVFWFCHLSAS